MVKSSVLINKIKMEIPFLLLSSLFFFPILPFGAQSVLIISTTIVSVFFGYKYLKRTWSIIKVKSLLINIFFYLLLILTLLYSANLKVGWRMMEVGLSFIIIPVIIFYFQPRLTKSKINTLLGLFVLSNLILVGYIFYYLVNNASDYAILDTSGVVFFIGLKDKGFIDQLITLWDSTFFEVFYYANKAKESSIFIHKTYVSQHLVWSVFICSYFLIRGQVNWFYKFVNLLLIGIYSAVIVYLFSLINIIILITLLPIFIFILLRKKRARIIYVVSCFLIVIAVLNSVNFKPKLATSEYGKTRDYERPSHIMLNIDKMLKKDKRQALTRCNMELIKENPFLGYGVGDVQDNLQACYDNFSANDIMFKEAKDLKLNTHNYYAFLWLSGGILLVFIFISMIGHNVFIGIKEKDFLYVFFLLILAINLMTESTMVRISGIMFFSLFNSLFYYKNMILNDQK